MTDSTPPIPTRDAEDKLADELFDPGFLAAEADPDTHGDKDDYHLTVGRDRRPVIIEEVVLHQAQIA